MTANTEQRCHTYMSHVSGSRRVDHGCNAATHKQTTVLSSLIAAAERFHQA